MFLKSSNVKTNVLYLSPLQNKFPQFTSSVFLFIWTNYNQLFFQLNWHLYWEQNYCCSYLRMMVN